MHQDPEHEEYDDDEYKYYPQNDQDNQSIPFSFDWNVWELWLADVLKDIVTEGDSKDVSWTFTFPQYSSQKNNENKIESSLDDDKFIFFGKNQHEEAIWKTKYFKQNYFNSQYQNHFMSHAAHIVRQPRYYRSMFDILN